MIWINKLLIDALHSSLCISASGWISVFLFAAQLYRNTTGSCGRRQLVIWKDRLNGTRLIEVRIQCKYVKKELDIVNILWEICLWHSHTHLSALCPGWWAGTRKVKSIWILLKQETVSGSGISWAICKSAPRSRQITTPTPTAQFFYRPDALPSTQPTVSKHLWLSCKSIAEYFGEINSFENQSAFDKIMVKEMTLFDWLTNYNNHLTASFPGQPGWAGTRKVNQSGIYWSKRQWVAVASAGPYASLHLAPDR